MNLPEFGVKKPVTNLMIFLSIIILALYSLTRIGIDSFPKIEPPVVSVIAGYPGASPEDVEIKVTEALENQLSTTPGLEKITSFSAEGVSVISLKFTWGTAIDAATNDIRDRIELAKRFLPDIPNEMDNPFIFKFNTSNIPILALGITAKESYPDLYTMIDKRLGDALRQLPGVGAVQFQGGGLERQINIWVDRQRLEGYDFSILDIQNVLARENITQPVGNIKMGLTDYLIRLPGEFATPDEIKHVILGKRNDKPVYLKDVTRIEDGFKEEMTKVRINRQRGLVMMIQKQSDTNTVEVAAMAREKIAEISKTLPSDVKIITIFDTSEDIINSLNSLKSSLWLAILLVIFVVWFFLRQGSPSFIIALTIPFSLMVTFIYLFLSGKTINSISLSSVAIVSGMVVDNAIVVVDNIFRRLERGQRPQEAAIFGTSEMFLAIGASTLTTIVVFLPMLFIPGVIGIFFGELAVIVTVTLLASLFTAATFTPMLCSRWMRVASMGSAQIARQGLFKKFYDVSEGWFRRSEEFYARCLAWCLKHKKTVILGFLGSFFFSLVLVRFVGTEFIPEEDTGDLRITVSMPIGTRVEVTDKVASRIEDMVEAGIPEATYYYVRSGQIPGIGRTFGNASGTHIVTAGVKLVSKDKRKRSVKDVAQDLRIKIAAIPGVLKTDVSTGNPIGRLITGGGGKAIQLEIIGHSFEDTDTFAKKAKSIMEKVPGTVDVSISRELDRPEMRLEVDREKSAMLGLNMSTIANSVKTFIAGSTASKYREKGETYDIFVRLEDASRSKLSDIENLSIAPVFNTLDFSRTSLKSNLVKLSNVAKIYETTGPEEIERVNRERVVRVECNTFGRSSGRVVEDINKELKKIPLPADVIVNFGGEAEEQRKAFADLALLLLLGLVLVYMVMAAQFESLLDPFIIMFSVPFTFTGVILALFVTRITLSIISFLGVIMLMGIVVNNAIVLVSYINILRARGLTIYEAITQGGKARLRPVLMTTITTLAGLLPLALSRGEGSETWQPLGVTMLGGLMVSTLITMLFVPTMYAIFESRVKKNGGNKK
jgi:HAE1 family hydrophobic/amphiphilic exporter-1